MQKYAVIVAGGSGVRMGANIPKQFLLLNQKPILWHTINSFIQAYNDIHIILVLPKAYIDLGEKLLNEFEADKHIVVGGETRFDSVKNGLELIKQECVVFVHDGVRCLISTELIQRCYVQTIKLGSAIPAVAATDSIRFVNEDHHQAIDRTKVQIIQTPQTFLSSIIIPAFLNQSYNSSFTDEATVVEQYGSKVFLCNGDYNNIKITRPVDLLVAEEILKDK